MGSSSTNIPPPDPRLIDAQIKSMGVQDRAAESILDIAKQQAAANASLLPIQKESGSSLDASEKALEQGQADRFGRLGRRRSSLRRVRREHRQRLGRRHQWRLLRDLARELGEG